MGTATIETAPARAPARLRLPRTDDTPGRLRAGLVAVLVLAASAAVPGTVAAVTVARARAHRSHGRGGQTILWRLAGTATLPSTAVLVPTQRLPAGRTDRLAHGGLVLARALDQGIAPVDTPTALQTGASVALVDNANAVRSGTFR